MRIQSAVASFTLVVLVASQAAGQAKHPSFAGVWTLDATKTTAEGQLGAPTSATYTIVQHGDTIVGDRVAETAEAGTVTSHIVWAADGKVWKNMVPVNGETIETSTVLTWNADTLLFKTTLTVQATPVDQLDQWSLSSDGKTLSMRRSISAMGQDIGSSTLVFVKKS